MDFGSILVIFRFRGYFGHFLGLRIFGIFKFRGYFGLFWGLGGYFGKFLVFEGILVIFWVLEVFWSFLGFEGILVIFWVSGIFWLFFGFRGYFGHF